MSETISVEALEVLQTHRTLVLAVACPDNSPHAAPLYYAFDPQRMALIVISSPSTQHGSAMQKHKCVAGAIVDAHASFANAMGIQFRGTCHRLEGMARQEAQKIYWERHPEISAADDKIQALWIQATFWAIKLSWLRLVDNRQSFGHKQEWRFAEGSPPL